MEMNLRNLIALRSVYDNDLKLIDEETEICFRNPDMYVLAHGKWYQDNVLNYENKEIERFTWQDGKLFIDLK